LIMTDWLAFMGILLGSAVVTCIIVPLFLYLVEMVIYKISCGVCSLSFVISKYVINCFFHPTDEELNKFEQIFNLEPNPIKEAQGRIYSKKPQNPVYYYKRIIGIFRIKNTIKVNNADETYSPTNDYLKNLTSSPFLKRANKPSREAFIRMSHWQALYRPSKTHATQSKENRRMDL
jgi:hypothetical protein